MGHLKTPPPVVLGSVEGRQQPKERTGQLTPPSLCQPVDRVGGRFSALVDLPGDEEPDEVPKPYDTNHVLAWRDPGLPTPVFVRMDSSGVFYTYPTLGDEPLQSLDDVQSAVISHACRGSNGMSEELSYKERVIRKRLYWPDGTTKVSTRAQVAEREQEKVHRLVKALLDKQNDDKGGVDELKDIVHWQLIREGVHKWYYHLNITVKTKGAADDAGSASLFFVEVARDRNDILGYYISSFFRVNTDSKAICHGCINNGSTDMKHPPAGLFKGGNMDICFPSGYGPCNEKQWVDSNNSKEKDEELIKKEENRIRKCFDCLDDPVYLANCRKKQLHFNIYRLEPDISWMLEDDEGAEE